MNNRSWFICSSGALRSRYQDRNTKDSLGEMCVKSKGKGSERRQGESLNGEAGLTSKKGEREGRRIG